jgi:hypothetical protein
MNKKFLGYFAIGLLILAGASAARAGQITLLVSGSDNGTLNLTEGGDNTLVTDISGTFDSSSITALVPPMSGEWDDKYYTTVPYFDTFGIMFETSNGNFYNLSNNTPTAQISVKMGTTATAAYGVGEYDNIAVQSVPEPAGFLLTLLGLVGVFAVRSTLKRSVQLD